MKVDLLDGGAVPIYNILSSFPAQDLSKIRSVLADG